MLSCVCHNMYMEAKGKLGVSSLLSRGSWDSNSNCQVWAQVILSHRSIARQPFKTGLFIFFKKRKVIYFIFNFYFLIFHILIVVSLLYPPQSLVPNSRLSRSTSPSASPQKRAGFSGIATKHHITQYNKSRDIPFH